MGGHSPDSLKSGLVGTKGLLDDEGFRRAAEICAEMEAGEFETVRVCFIDQHGILRGKTLVADALASAFRSGVAMTSTLLLKDTSLVSVIALEDLLRKTNIAVGATKEPFFFYMTACLIYLTMSLISSLGVARADKWASRGEVRR